MAQPDEKGADRGEQQGGGVAILNVRGVDLFRNQPAAGVCEDMGLRPFTIFAASHPRGPSASVILTDWLSITPAVGLAPRSRRFARTREEHD